MSEHRHVFAAGERVSAVLLPFELSSWIAQWSGLRAKMLGGPPPEFTRDEWAYLITFLDGHTLEGVFEQTFGRPAADGASITELHKPRGGAAVWLPNNASLLGPLMLVLISLTGSPVRAKAGSRVGDLAGAFVRYAAEKLGPGELREYMNTRVRIEQFGRDDARNAEMSAWAATRIAFGGDAAVKAIAGLPHAPSSRMYGFADHRSEAWVHPDVMDDAAVTLLGRVFAIYGRAGCTSPARVLVIDGNRDDAARLRDRLLGLWPRIMPQRTAVHLASQNIMASQLARGLGWADGVRLAPDHGAVLLAGDLSMKEVPGFSVLPIMPATLADALATLPANIQTVGHALRDPRSPELLAAVASRPIKRYVPLGQMHHFGPVWDGYSYWRELFEVVQVS